MSGPVDVVDRDEELTKALCADDLMRECHASPVTVEDGDFRVEPDLDRESRCGHERLRRHNRHLLDDAMETARSVGHGHLDPPGELVRHPPDG